MIKVRRDKNALAIFAEKTGNKIRFAIGAYEKARVPELVDIKITDYCPFGCAFCYQDSTTAGAHASTNDLDFIASELGKHGVFEVALGGGEPTDHPNFLWVLRRFREAGVVPNFTTKSLGYVKRNWPYIEDYVGAFAYSAETMHDLHKANTMLSEVPRDRVNIHYVMGLQGKMEFMSFMALAKYYGFRVTLLGYKTVGRGGDVEHQSYDWWIDAVRKLAKIKACPTFSIDTPMAAEFSGRMPVNKRFYHTKEGFVSAYIDAVQMGMSASSFENQDLLPFDNQWLKTYATIRPT